MALKLKGSTSGFVGLDAPSVAGNNTLILPENSGSAGQILANDITAGVTTFTQVTVSRNGDLTVPGTISIGGTLTYEDVTSVDSIGIITARGLSIFGNTTGLQVASGISTFQALTSTSGTFTGGIDVTSNVTISDSIVHSGDTNTKIRFPAADIFAVETAGSERLRVGAGGSVGIGTDVPDTLLHLYGSSSTSKLLTFSGGASKRNNYIGITGADNLEIAVDENNEGSGSTLRFRIDGGEKARITSDGKVGIGTDNVHETLQIQDGHIVIGQNSGDNTGIRNYIKFGRADAPKAAIGFLNDTGNGRGDFIFINSDVSNTSAFTDSDEVMRITHEGNVGINTDIPASRLDVTASSVHKSWSQPTSVVSKFERDGICRVALVAANTSNSQIDFGDNDDDNAGYIRYDHSENRMGFRTNGASNEHMIINSSGIVALGVTTARYDDLLQVEGTGGDSAIAVIRNSNNGSGAGLLLGKSRTNSVGGNTIVQDDDKLGVISFGGADGTDLASIAAQITGEVDGTPGENDMPGRIIFKTTSDGSAGTTERVRIDSGGRMGVGLEPNTSDVATNISPGLIQTDGNIDLRYSGTNNDPAGARYVNFVNTDTTLVAGQPMGGFHWIGMDSGNPNSITASILADCSGNAGDASHLLFSTGGTLRIRIKTDGNLVSSSGSTSRIAFGSGDGTLYSGIGYYAGGNQDVGLSLYATTNAGVAFVEHFRMEHNGTLKGTDTSIGSLSDSRLKKDIADYSYDISKFKQFKPKSFNWINPEVHGDKSNVKGFLAQDIETVDGDWVEDSWVNKDDPDFSLISDTTTTNGAGETVGVSKMSKFGYKDAMYISVIQQLIGRIETLETKVAALEG